MKKKIYLSLFALLIIIIGIYLFKNQNFSFKSSQKEISQINNQENKEKNILTYAISNDINSFDNTQMIESISIDLMYGHIYESLVGYDSNKNKFIPVLAKDWKLSNNNKTYEFQLKQNIVFHDQTAFNAEVVKLNLERLKDAEISPVLSQFLIGIQEINIIDNYKLKITLTEPDNTFLAKISTATLASSKAIQEDKLNQHPIGTGPLKFKEHQLGEKIILEKNENYWGGKSNLQELKILIIKDDLGKSLALKNNKIDFWLVRGFDPNLENLVKEKNISFKKTTGNTVNSIWFNQNLDQFQSKQFRLALAKSIDKKEIIKILKDFGSVAKGPVPTFYSVNNSQVNDYSFNLEEAKKLYQQNQVNEPIEIIYINDSAINKSISEYIANQWRKIGLDVKIQGYDITTAIGKVNKGEFQTLLTYLGGIYPDPLFFMEFGFSSNGPYSNALGYQNKELDQLLKEAKLSFNNKVQEKKLIESQQIIIQDIPAIFIYDSNIGILFNNQKIKNFELDNFLPLKNLNQIKFN
jgi:peptide/nickel transport system substrate-binding protein